MIKRFTQLVLFFVIILVFAISVLSIGFHPAKDASAQQEPAQPDQPQASLVFGSKGKGGDFLISKADTESNQVVAYNSIEKEYLVVMVHYSVNQSENEIRGQIISEAGCPRGDAIIIASHESPKYDPSVVFNPNRNEYLVIWDEERIGSNQEQTDVYGQRLSAAGVLLDNPTTPAVETDPTVNFPITTAPGRQNFNDLAHNSISDEYLVVWLDNRNSSLTGDDIYGQRLDGDGYFLGNSDPAVNFPISSALQDQLNPTVAFHAGREEYMVVWLDHRNETDIYGQRVKTDGSLIGSLPDINVRLTENYDIWWEPAIAYNSDAQNYLLVISGRTSPDADYDIIGTLISGTGTVLAVTQITSQIDDQTIPDVFYASGWGYLVAFSDKRNALVTSYDIYGQRVNALGSPADYKDFQIVKQAGDQLGPKIAFSPTAHQFLVTWEKSYYSYEIYAQRLWLSTAQAGHAFSVSSPIRSQTNPAVAFNSRDHEYLAVWIDERSPSGLIEVYGQLYNRNGYAIDKNLDDLTASSGGILKSPSVAYDSNHDRYLLTWVEGSESLLKGRYITARGSPINAPFTIATGATANSVITPMVAYDPNPTVDAFLVVFKGNSGGVDSIQYRWVKDTAIVGSGAIEVMGGMTSLAAPSTAYNAIDDKFLITWERDGDIIYAFLPYGSPSSIPQVLNNAADTQSVPVAAWNSDDNQFLVAWHDYRNSSTQGADIYAQRIDNAGTKLGEDFKVSTHMGLDNQQYPALAYLANEDLYRIAWQDDREATTGYDIRGQWISRAGAVLGAFDAPIFIYEGYQERPVIAYDPDYHNALVAWQDGRNGMEYDIYGRFSSVDLTLPTANFTVDPRIGVEGDTFVFNGAPSYDEETPTGWLRTRWDFNTDGTWDTDFSLNKMITRTINTAGDYTVTMQVMDTSFMINSVTHTIRVWPETSSPTSLPPQPSFTPDLTVAEAGDTFTFDASASTGATNPVFRWDWENDGVFDTDFTTALTVTHVYTIADDYTVRLEMVDDSNLSTAAFTNILVNPDTPVGLMIAPQELVLPVGRSVEFRANSWDTYGNPMFNPPVTWSVQLAQAGTIDEQGLFTASLVKGIYTDAIKAVLGLLSDTASVELYWPRNIFLPYVVKK